LRICAKIVGKHDLDDEVLDFRPSHQSSDQELADKLGLFVSGIKVLISPRCVGGKTIVPAGVRFLDKIRPWFYRTSNKVDGAIVRGAGSGVVIFNADCPVVGIRQGDYLGVFHCGRSGLSRPSILADAGMHFDLEEVEEVLFGFGIGPCCYGIGENSEPSEGMLAVQNGPYAGQISLDLRAEIRSQLLAMGVSEAVLCEHGICTACSGRLRDSKCEGDYHSNVWDANGDPSRCGRNATILWLEE